MKKLVLIGVIILIACAGTITASGAADSQGSDAVMSNFPVSWNANRYALVFFYSEMNDTVKAQQAGFETIAAELKDKADPYIVNITDPKQADVVNRYKLTRAPMPFVLVLAPNGAVTGGFPQNFTKDSIQRALVGPLTAQCLKALQSQKYVLACFQGADAAANDSAMKGVTDFKNDMMYNLITEVVIFNATDPTEQGLMQSLGIQGKPAEPVTVFLAPPGALIGKYTGKTDKDTLVTALKSRTTGGGCCPSGSGKTCN